MGRTVDVREKVSSLPTYSGELGLDLRKAADRFKWFLASILFAKRTYREFGKRGIVTAESIIEAGWDKLVEILDSGGYVRYDFSTASNLLQMANSLKQKCGSLEDLYAQAKDSDDLEKRLLEFKGVGPTTVNIFLRELKTVWTKARPKLSPLAGEVASKIGLSNTDTNPPGLESALVRLSLEFCKRRRRSGCPVKAECQEAKAP